MNVTREHRTLHFTDMPEYHHNGTPTSNETRINCGNNLSVILNYTGEGNAFKGIALDNIIIPIVLEALRNAGIQTLKPQQA